MGECVTWGALWGAAFTLVVACFALIGLVVTLCWSLDQLFNRR